MIIWTLLTTIPTWGCHIWEIVRYLLFSSCFKVCHHKQLLFITTRSKAYAVGYNQKCVLRQSRLLLCLSSMSTTQTKYLLCHSSVVIAQSLSLFELFYCDSLNGKFVNIGTYIERIIDASRSYRHWIKAAITQFWLRLTSMNMSLSCSVISFPPYLCWYKTSCCIWSQQSIDVL